MNEAEARWNEAEASCSEAKARFSGLEAEALTRTLHPCQEPHPRSRPSDLVSTGLRFFSPLQSWQPY